AAIRTSSITSSTRSGAGLNLSWSASVGRSNSSGECSMRSSTWSPSPGYSKRWSRSLALAWSSEAPSWVASFEWGQSSWLRERAFVIEIHYKDWLLRCDSGATQAAYARIGNGAPERCGCDDCHNFIALREQAYPREVLDLFAHLGIDHRHEAE